MAVWSCEKYIDKPLCMAISLGSLQSSYRWTDEDHSGVDCALAVVTAQPCDFSTSGLNTL